MIKSIRSGMQDGADLAGVMVGKEFSLEVGGTMPKGFKTLSGNHPEYADLYGIVEHDSPKYPPRTECNVVGSDGTIRFASDFDSPGEKLTLRLCKKHLKPCYDIDLSLVKSEKNSISKCVEWLKLNKIETLNVAGNTDKRTFELTKLYLTKLFEKLGLERTK